MNNVEQGEDVPDEQENVNTQWLSYSGLALIIMMLHLFLTSLVTIIVCDRSTNNLHMEMSQRMLGGNMSFFDSSPTGGILNHFLKDINLLDETLVPDGLALLVTMKL